MRVLVTGIKSYLARLTGGWAETGRRFDAFEPIRTKKEVMSASRLNGNTGNYFIGEGALEAIGREKAHFMDFGHLRSSAANADHLDKINSHFDCAVFVTANLLRSDYDAAAEAELLSRLNLPIVVLGIGCQRVRDLQQGMPDGTRRLIEVLKSKEHQVFARGEPTTAYLKSEGLQNVWATGCPSMFFRPDNVLRAFRDLKAVDWSTRLRIVFSGYLGRDATSVADIEALSDRGHACSYVLQDEHLFYDFKLDSADDAVVYDDVSGQLSRHCSFAGSSRIPDVSLRIFFNTHQWRVLMSTHDVSLGRRFHGVVAGLQAGRPGLMITVDDRMREMITQLHLPRIDAKDWASAPDKRRPIEAAVKSFNFEHFSEEYMAQLGDFRRRLSSFGLG